MSDRVVHHLEQREHLQFVVQCIQPVFNTEVEVLNRHLRECLIESRPK